jgi:hypothetical protein
VPAALLKFNPRDRDAMFIFMVLAQRLRYSIDRPSSSSVTLPSFVFQSGGQFEVEIGQAAADAVFIGVCTASEVRFLQSLTNPDDALCLPNSTLVD